MHFSPRRGIRGRLCRFAEGRPGKIPQELLQLLVSKKDIEAAVQSAKPSVLSKMSKRNGRRLDMQKLRCECVCNENQMFQMRRRKNG